MAKVHSLNETERLLISLEDVADDETCVLDNEGLDLKDNAGQVDQVPINSISKKDATLEEFNKLLFESVDEALSSLGEAVKNTLYLHLKNDFNIKPEEIPNKICEFSDILHKIFGLGARRLELKCMKNLCEKVRVSIAWPEYEWPMSKWFVNDITFPEYVTNSLQSFVAKRKNNISNR
jgi:hypothetical protein